MKICIDMRPALSNATGVGMYLQNLVHALAGLDETNEYHLFSSSWKERYQPPFYGSNFVIHDSRWPVSMLNYTWHRWSRPKIEALIGTAVDIAHSPSPLLTPSDGAHRITTVMDLYFLTHPEHTSREIRRDYTTLAKDHCRRSDAIIAISEYTRQQLIDLLNVPPSHIYTIRLGADPFFATEPAPEDFDPLRSTYNLREPFFLFVGAREPRKNLDRLLDAFAPLACRARLVLAGPLTSPVHREGVIEPGYVSRPALRALYHEAHALVMPSLDEGFGLPLMEAMSAGTPVLASDIPAFQEVGGDAFYSFNPNNVEEIRAAMLAVLESPGLRGKLKRAGKERVQRFSWQEVARKTLELYQNL